MTKIQMRLLYEDQFNKGCTSPVMLYEAAKIISNKRNIKEKRLHYNN